MNMKHVGRVAALCGLLFAIWLVWRDNPATIVELMRKAGFGLVLAALVHVLPMLANAWDWRLLIRRAQRPTLAFMLRLVWIRESVNGLLPVARIGGELVSFRLLGRQGVRPAAIVASLVTDIQLTLISQVIFALLAIACLLAQTSSMGARVAAHFALGIALFMPILLLFALVQHARPFERAANLVNRVTGGKVYGLMGNSRRIDDSIKSVWRQTSVVMQYLVIWQTLQCLGLALEIWIALHALGVNATFAQAFVFEALIQLASSIAFLVPGSLGVQEGSFVLIGSVLGIDAPTCLALAGARRLRDLLFYLPGLVAWQIEENAPKAAALANTTTTVDRAETENVSQTAPDRLDSR
ncbi:putative membrane protein [Paraburkholderia tropica]|uniref:Membrane protein n=2 Tax=Paraburkholderia tropica TaxID=92647 RepID=A0ABX5MQ51_9BURK|nr:putative membrane protein [Paraburkholderia tropica]PZW82072.1 putative membrane protein [Paraburkholderia tropica]